MRFIDGDALQAEHIEAYGKRLLLIDTAPTIEQSEIIRCRECIWWKNGDCQNPLGLFMPDEDSFCSGGARRDT